jgi:hypothetical protein
MKTEIVDAGEGVLLEVKHTPDAGVCDIESVRVLDVNYRPTGPDLSRWLDSLYLIRPDGATLLLSTLTEQLA